MSSNDRINSKDVDEELQWIEKQHSTEPNDSLTKTPSKISKDSLKNIISKVSSKERILFVRDTSRSSTKCLVSSDTLSVKRRKGINSSLSEGERRMKNDKDKHLPKKPSDRSTNNSVLSALNCLNQERPSSEHDLRYVKLFLQKQGIQNISIWSHLTKILNKIIAEQPDNVIDYFEEYSRKIKQETLTMSDSLRDVYIPSPCLESAKNQLSLINSYGIKAEEEEPEVAEEEEKVEPPKNMDLEEVAFYFSQAGIAIPAQVFTLNIAMKKLAEEKTLLNPRFWGKIFGTKQDYFIFECELTEEEYERRAEVDEQRENEEAEKTAAAQEDETEEKLSENSFDKDMEFFKDEDKGVSEEKEDVGEKADTEDIDGMKEEGDEDPLLPPLPPPKKLITYKIPPILKPVVKEIVKIPAEKVGEGLNRKIYYVSNNPELSWTELPRVTPEQINVARQTKVIFSGDLESKITTFPAFPGTEQNYLRAQIARISSSTQVSPVGFYQFGEGGDEEEEEEEVAEEEETAEKTKYTENPNFRPIPMRDMIDPSFSSWVHHSQHILKQGRTEWWDAKKAAAGEEEAEEEQEEEEEEDVENEGGEKEIGPALLTSLAEDATIEGSPAWSVKRSHNYNTDLAAAVIRSNLWPGAWAFATGKKFENIYVGWGHKHLPHGFSPAMLPHPEYEYDLGPEVLEIQDPTVEVEESWRQAHKKKPPPAEGEEGGEEEEEEEEEEEDDD